MRRLGNLSLWAINLGAAAVIGNGFDSQIAQPSLLSAAGGILALDGLSYALHRAQHAAPALWRLHRLHHSDEAVDVTTAVRNHPIEVMLAAPLVWLAIGVCHIPAEVVGVYGAMSFVMMLTTHTRRAWPRWFERVLTPVIVTREMHLLHHSAEPAEADTNFGGIFCWWDRLFGTFSPGRVPERFGI